MADETQAPLPSKPAPRRHGGSGLGPIAGRWPFFVWLLFIPALIALYEYGGGYFELNGSVEFDFEAVSGRENGRVDDVKVTIGQKVKRGDLLVVLDTGLLDKEIAAIKEELALDRLDRDRRFATAVQRLRVDVSELLMDQASDTAELAIFNRQLERLRTLLENGLVDREIVGELEAKVAVLEKRGGMQPELIAKVKADLADAEARLDEVHQNERPGNSRLALLEERRENCFLRAANDGVVAEINYQKGENVPAGDPVVRLVIKEYDSATGEEVKRVLGFQPERFSHQQPSPGDELIVYPETNPEARIRMKVVSVTPHVLNFPGRVRNAPNRMSRGRNVHLLTLPGQNHEALVPGEWVIIETSAKGAFSFLLGS